MSDLGKIRNIVYEINYTQFYYVVYHYTFGVIVFFLVMNITLKPLLACEFCQVCDKTPERIVQKVKITTHVALNAK